MCDADSYTALNPCDALCGPLQIELISACGIGLRNVHGSSIPSGESMCRCILEKTSLLRKDQKVLHGYSWDKPSALAGTRHSWDKPSSKQACRFPQPDWLNDIVTKERSGPASSRDRGLRIALFLCKWLPLA